MSDDTESAPDAETGKDGSRRKRLLPRDWLEIVQMARTGVPVAKIAETYGVTPPSIYRGLKERRVVIGAYTASSTPAEESEERKELVKRVRETKDQDYRYTEFLQKQAIKTLMDNARDGHKPSKVMDDLKALDAAMKVIRSGTDNKWKILGLDKDNEDVDKELPELPIREMTAAEITATRDQQLLDDAELMNLESDLEAEFEEDERVGGDDGE